MSVSNLVTLLNNLQKYTRLNNLPNAAPPAVNKIFSARGQSGDAAQRQNTAANFLDIAKLYQDEFTVNQSANTLTGRRKSTDSNFTKFTTQAQNTYLAQSSDAILKEYKSQLIHKYLATDTNQQFKTKNSNCAGITLVYNPAL